MQNYVRQFVKIKVLSTRFISETKWVTSNFFAFLAQVAHYLTAVKKKIKSLLTVKFSRERP